MIKILHFNKAVKNEISKEDLVNCKKINEFYEVQSYLDDVDSINRGGCGISAYIMKKWLRENEPHTKCVYILGYNGPCDFITNNQAVLGEADPTSCAHMGLIIYHSDGTQSIEDSGGTYRMLNYSYTSTFHSDFDMLNAINRVDQWNDEFDRDNIKQIAIYLNLDLSEIDCRSSAEYKRDMKKKKKQELLDEDAVDKIHNIGFFESITKLIG